MKFERKTKKSDFSDNFNRLNHVIYESDDEKLFFFPPTASLEHTTWAHAQLVSTWAWNILKPK